MKSEHITTAKLAREENLRRAQLLNSCEEEAFRNGFLLPCSRKAMVCLRNTKQALCRQHAHLSKNEMSYFWKSKGK
jgi:hypothetical protein